jgi:hypothetical protein
MSKRLIRAAIVTAAAGALMLGAFSGSAFAAAGYTLFGDATLVTPGNASAHAVQLTTIGTNGYSGIDFPVPSGLTFAGVTNLSTDTNFTTGSCGSGSPRFQINVDGKNAFVYIGPPPNYTGCPANVWSNTGNLVTPTSFVDTSQLPGGTFYDTFAAADAKYGSDLVTGIQLVADGSGQVVLIDNTMINSATFTYEPNTPTSKDQCKDGGWQTHVRADFSSFKNQGDCIQYVNTGK